jgi:hypothetical protein
MSNTIYSPGVGGSPYGNNLAANPQASNYQAISAPAYGVNETIHLEKVVKSAIYDAAPAQYNLLKLLFSKAFETVPSDEFTYLEKTFGRSPVTVTANALAVAAIPGSSVQQTYTVSAASLDNISLNMKVVFPDNTQGVVVAINPAGPSITVESYTDLGLPAVTAPATLSVQSTVRADGMDRFDTYQRMNTIERYNFVQFFLRADRWGRVELQKWKNTGKTDYLVKNTKERIDQLRFDIFATFINGVRGELRLANGELAKAMGGIYPTMVAAGSANAASTVAALPATFEALADQTNFKAEGETRFIIGTQRVLHELAKSYKVAGLRYTPNDMVANLGLEQYVFGGMKFVPVPCELLKENSIFPADFASKLIVVDMESITPKIMQGIPAVEMGDTLGMPTREGFVDSWVGGQLSIEFNNPQGGFWIDVTL